MSWDKPKPVDAMTAAFPANVIGTLLPLRHEIPDEFDSWNNKWNRLASSLFFKGGRLPKVKAGIDAVDAHKHLSAVLASFQPKHEHKLAGAGYLMSLWFEVNGAEASET